MCRIQRRRRSLACDGTPSVIAVASRKGGTPSGRSGVTRYSRLCDRRSAVTTCGASASPYRSIRPIPKTGCGSSCTPTMPDYVTRDGRLGAYHHQILRPIPHTRKMQAQIRNFATVSTTSLAKYAQITQEPRPKRPSPPRDHSQKSHPKRRQPSGLCPGGPLCDRPRAGSPWRFSKILGRSRGSSAVEHLPVDQAAKMTARWPGRRLPSAAEIRAKPATLLPQSLPSNSFVSENWRKLAISCGISAH